jgi:hypothetical protein
VRYLRVASPKHAPDQGQSDIDADNGDGDDDVLHQWMLSVVLSDRGNIPLVCYCSFIYFCFIYCWVVFTGESEPDRPHVSRSLFLLFLLRFGPLEHCLEKVRDALDHGKMYLSRFIFALAATQHSPHTRAQHTHTHTHTTHTRTTHSWFHGNQPRDPSERLLEENIKDGLFLVRYSSSPGHFTVDYIKNGKMYHFNSIRNNFAGPGVVVNIKLDSDKMKEFRYSFLAFHPTPQPSF